MRAAAGSPRSPAPAALLALCGLLALGGCKSESELIYQNQLRNDLLVMGYRGVIEDGISTPFYVDIPPSTKSLLIEVRGSMGKYYPLKLESPPPKHDLVESGEFISRSARSFPGLVQWLVPLRPGVNLPPGTYTFTLYAEDWLGSTVEEEEIEVRFYAKIAVPSQGCGLYLDILFDRSAVPVENFEAVADELAQTVNTTLSAAGIQIIDYSTQHLIMLSPDANLDESSAIVGIGSMLQQARRSGSARNGAIHTMMLRSIGGKLNPAGYSLGLPGPYDAQLPSAAILVATDKFSSPSGMNISAMSSTLVHEIGHYLGLYHPSDSGQEEDALTSGYGPPHDPLPDTPECEGFSCDPEFYRNVMTPGKGSLRSILTPQQAEVMANHPLCVPFEGTF